MLDNMIMLDDPEGKLGSSNGTASDPPPILAKVARRVTDVSTLPHIAAKVIEVANDPTSGASRLKVVLEQDIALSARVLRTVNSAAYCPRTKITNLLQAISYLGFRQIRNLAVTASVRQVFRPDVGADRYSPAGLWRHMVSVAICARMMALRKELANFEDAYLAGLLHDLGILLESQHAAEEFSGMMRGLDETRTLVENEETRLGFNHMALGTLIGEQWKFPSSVQTAIGFHHRSQEYQGEDAAILHCVAAANFLCSVKGISSVGVNLVPPPVHAIHFLGFEREDLKILAEDLDAEMELRKDLFNV